MRNNSSGPHLYFPAMYGKVALGIFCPTGWTPMKNAMKLRHSLVDRVSRLFEMARSSSRPRRRVVVGALALTTAASVLAAALIFPFKIMADSDELTTFTVDVVTDAAANFRN